MKKKQVRFRGRAPVAPRARPVDLDLEYVVLGKSVERCAGKGRTTEVGQKLLRFRADEPVGVGALLEITIPWSIQLDGKIRLKLIVKGRVVRSVEGEITVKVERHEFRTRASKSVRA